MSFQELFSQAKAAAGDLMPPTGIAAALAGLIFLLFGWPWRSPKPTRTAVGAVLGVSVGFFAGCWWLGVRPQWPPLEDQDRFLLILFPAVMVVELVAALLFEIRTKSEPRMKHGLNTERNPLSSVAHWVLSLSVWLLRLVIAVLASRILLHNSSYITDLSGP